MDDEVQKFKKMLRTTNSDNITEKIIKKTKIRQFIILLFIITIIFTSSGITITKDNDYRLIILLFMSCTFSYIHIDSNLKSLILLRELKFKNKQDLTYSERQFQTSDQR